MSDKINPCPICAPIESRVDIVPMNGLYIVVCRHCHVQVANPFRHQALVWWNQLPHLAEKLDAAVNDATQATKQVMTLKERIAALIDERATYRVITLDLKRERDEARAIARRLYYAERACVSPDSKAEVTQKRGGGVG